MKQLWLIVLLCASGMMVGCSAVGSRAAARVSAPPAPMYFGGIRLDYCGCVEFKNGYGPWFWPAYCAMDIPFSFGADVLLIPYDLYTDLKWSGRTNDTAVARSD